MSGARALAAARNRRAGPTNTNNTPAPSSYKSINNSSRVSNETPTGQKVNPAMMLLSHNKILSNLQTVVEDLNTKFENQEKELKADLKENTTVDDATLEYYKNKIITIESSLEEIKKHTLSMTALNDCCLYLKARSAKPNWFLIANWKFSTLDNFARFRSSYTFYWLLFLTF